MITIHDKALATACNAVFFSDGSKRLWGKKLENIIDIANHISGKKLLIKTTGVHTSIITGITTILYRELTDDNGTPYATEDYF